ncbi:MAG TPA: FAD-binding oxidoreductase [Pseudomonadales bacterium]
MSASPIGYQSWGRYPASRPARAWRMRWRDERLPACREAMLPYGNGRSYGDSCLNDAGVLLDTRGLDRFIHFDRTQGVIRCEAGVLLADILDLVVPTGWFLPVTPGTRFVTVGGAIANDVHGKNHHRAGSFGRHVRAFELLRSDGSRYLCTPEQNVDWFGATIGGLGLTGVIVWAEIELVPIPGPLISVESVRMPSLDAFFRLSAASDRDYEYTVAWIDCLARGRALGRGLFMRGNHVRGAPGAVRHRRLQPAVPVTPPFSLVNDWTLKPLNALYYHRQRRERRQRIDHYEPFFYPLDGVRQWNRLYGPRGFLQYQCVVPHRNGPDTLVRLLERIAEARTGSLLSVLKVFGDRPSPGWLSFPRPGITLALDFPNRGSRTLELLARLDELVLEADGAVYPAKDARMGAALFRHAFPRWRCLRRYADPAFSSDLWRRLGGGCA